MPNGKGKMTYHNGDTYEGNFSQGEQHGFGIMKYASGKVWSGRWVYGDKTTQKFL